MNLRIPYKSIIPLFIFFILFIFLASYQYEFSLDEGTDLFKFIREPDDFLKYAPEPISLLFLYFLRFADLPYLFYNYLLFFMSLIFLTQINKKEYFLGVFSLFILVLEFSTINFRVGLFLLIYLIFKKKSILFAPFFHWSLILLYLFNVNTKTLLKILPIALVVMFFLFYEMFVGKIFHYILTSLEMNYKFSIGTFLQIIIFIYVIKKSNSKYIKYYNIVFFLLLILSFFSFNVVVGRIMAILLLILLIEFTEKNKAFFTTYGRIGMLYVLSFELFKVINMLS